MRIVAIDPGATGAIVHGDTCSDQITITKMPDTLRDLYDHLRCVVSPDGHLPMASEAIVYIEKVGTYMPGNSGPSAATFAEHVGTLKMALIALHVRHEFVRPKAWMDAFIGKQSYPSIPKQTKEKERKRILSERKRERKNKIKAKAQEQFPLKKVTLVNADALGIFWYALQQHKNERPF